MSVEHSVECELAGETEETQRDPAPMPLCPPQIQYDLTFSRTRAI
jgi:hypothetical protein